MQDINLRIIKIVPVDKEFCGVYLSDGIYSKISYRDLTETINKAAEKSYKLQSEVNYYQKDAVRLQELEAFVKVFKEIVNKDVK